MYGLDLSLSACVTAFSTAAVKIATTCNQVIGLQCLKQSPFAISLFLQFNCLGMPLGWPSQAT